MQATNLFARPCRRLTRLLGALAVLGSAVAAEAKSVDVLYNFCSQANCADGSGNLAPLIADAGGNLYGTTGGGGDKQEGAIYELTPTGSGQYSYAVLYSFCVEKFCHDGQTPHGALIIDTKGNLYGTTLLGGKNRQGEVFELLNQGGTWHLNILYSFCAGGNCTGGSMPPAGLTYAGAASGKPYDRKSPLFGTLSQGGNNSNAGGAAFQLTPGPRGWKEQGLYNFCSQSSCSDGQFPQTPLTMDADGNLYGTTKSGGSTNSGIVFELTPSGGTWNETPLYSFCIKTSCADGQRPNGGVSIDASGNLIGVTIAGGGNCDCGVLYSIAPAGTRSVETVLYTFCSRSNCADGDQPIGTPVLDKKGNIYGVTNYGGNYQSDGGIIYRFGGGDLGILHTFCTTNCLDGQSPLAGLFRDASGNLFGTTNLGGSGGGADGSGTAYELPE